MKCQDVRRALSFLVDGELPLTEWAIIQTHLRDCAECGRELDRVRAEAGERARTKRRRLIVAALGATAALLVTAAGGLYVYQHGSLPDLPRSDAFRLPSWGTAPVPPRTAAPTPVPEAPAPIAPAAVAPAAVVPPSMPPPARSQPVVEPPPRVAPPPEDRMPTQARPPGALSASPDAEAMPTQVPARPGVRAR